MERDEIKIWRSLPPESEETIIDVTNEEKLKIVRAGKNTRITRIKNNDIDSEYRFITNPTDILFIEPILPDYPLVIKPEMQLSVLPGMKLNAFIEVPLFVNIGVGTDKIDHCLIEFPLNPLSKSFFGSPESGEIAYFEESPLYEKVQSYQCKENMAYSPVLIKNRSNQILHFERMILRVPNLSLFKNKECIYTSPVDIDFKGQDQVSQIKIKQSAPKIEDLKLIASPRRPLDKSIIKKSFYFMKSIYSG
jgi:hypothetical protein